jgi:hypothetical protein
MVPKRETSVPGQSGSDHRHGAGRDTAPKADREPERFRESAQEATRADRCQAGRVRSQRRCRERYGTKADKARSDHGKSVRGDIQSQDRRGVGPTCRDRYSAGTGDEVAVI